MNIFCVSETGMNTNSTNRNTCYWKTVQNMPNIVVTFKFLYNIFYLNISWCKYYGNHSFT